jgi:hypothetical protein
MQKELRISTIRLSQFTKTAICVCFLFFVVFSVSAKKTPKIKLFKTTINLGHITKENRIQTFVIDFKNVGEADLFIRKVVPDCSCTHVDIINRNTHPKEQGQLKVILDLTPFFPGIIEKKVAVYTNASQEIKFFTIKGSLLSR